MALAATLFVGASLLVIVARFRPDIAFAALVAAAIVVGIGECFYTTVLSPLVAELAPISLRGRYMASIGFSWWIGLTLATTLGAQLLSVASRAIFLVAGAVAMVAAASALTLERAGLAEETLDRNFPYVRSNGEERVKPFWHTLVHVVNHGTQHRSEAAMLLTIYGASPGDLDLSRSPLS
jgi:MFS family permease